VKDVLESDFKGDSRRVNDALTVLDQAAKLEPAELRQRATKIGFDFDGVIDGIQRKFRLAKDGIWGATAARGSREIDAPYSEVPDRATGASDLAILMRCARLTQLQSFMQVDPSIVRGLAYYTGTVFEAIADGERAVAGGGRYDELVELFGGPPTPAAGFAMGDVVLSLLLEDKKLMPTGAELLEACSRPPASLRPEAFVVTADPGLDEAVLRLVAELRRPASHYRLDGAGRAVACASDGHDARPAEELKPWQRPAGLHARRSYKTTRNVGKLLDDAKKQHALCAVIVESAETAKVERLDTRESRSGVPLDRVGLTVRAMLGQIPA
jgi:histidyl-tRNA synthetase